MLDKDYNKWTDGQLKMEIASRLNDCMYIIMHELEKKINNYPVTREEMIKYLEWK
mgnify:CR=1 FL=1